MHRSLAIGGSLTRAHTERLLDACAALLAERVQMVSEPAHSDYGPAWPPAMAPPSEGQGAD
jgi:hypothetical protein